jgi:hypothetical protein
VLSWGEEILRCHVETEEVPNLGFRLADCCFTLLAVAALAVVGLGA